MALEGVQASEARHPGRTERGNGEAGPEAGRDETLLACRQHEGLGKPQLFEPPGADPHAGGVWDGTVPKGAAPIPIPKRQERGIFHGQGRVRNLKRGRSGGRPLEGSLSLCKGWGDMTVN